ncbi:DUF2163 domain-containing protein [Rhodovulum sp. DZ06]|uniref:DUF2163 domain-containing protein n=1 Tax=Rhodovulum sp. DZ06 TaxID=3425126 RepID=UPI003D34C822
MTRNIDDDILAALAEGCATLARCWLLERRDGVRLGFTDHDGALEFDGVTFEPESGFARTALEQGLGLSVDNMEAAGALRSEAVTEADLERGLYDGAVIRQWVVDWTDPENRTLVFAGSVGEVRRGLLGFEVEILGLSEALNRPAGRVYMRSCDAALGDGRCGVALTGAFAASGAVTRVIDDRSFEVSGLGQEAGWFSLGRVAWTSGGNAGETMRVQVHAIRGGVHVVTLWTAPPGAVEVGDAFDIAAGCDKSAATCRGKFDNILNFRGFPHLPGEDWMTDYPTSDEDHDGGSLFR